MSATEKEFVEENIPIVQCHIEGYETDSPPFVLVNEEAFKSLYYGGKKSKVFSEFPTSENALKATRRLLVIWWTIVSIDGGSHETFSRSTEMAVTLFAFVSYFINKTHRRKLKRRDRVSGTLFRFSFFVFFFVAWVCRGVYLFYGHPKSETIRALALFPFCVMYHTF